jgi:dTDP-4-dehydrorhamnose 3,5-epimerase
MIKDLIVKKLNKYTDKRGYLMEIFREDEIDFKVAMSYLSFTKSQVSRGPHEHRFQSDYFVFPGPGDFDLYLWDNRPNSSTYGEKMIIAVGLSNPCIVLVPPGIVHGYKCVSQEEAFSINLPNKLYKGRKKQEEVDEIRWEEKEDSPFKIN